MLNDRIEVRFLLAILDPGPSETKQAWLRETMLGVLDWTALVDMALKHGVVGLLDRGLRDHCADLLPGDLDEALSTFVASQRDRGSHMASELARLTTALERAGIRSLAFKGPALVSQTYGDFALRPFGDLDILIDWQDRDRLRAVFADLGYPEYADFEAGSDIHGWRALAMDRCAGQTTYSSEGAGVTVEPHWVLFPNTFALDIDHDGLWRRSKKTPLGGGEVRCLCKEDMLLIACLHGAKEQWWRLNWVCDVAAFVANTNGPPVNWTLLIERAGAQGCLRALLMGVALANKVFEVAPPEEIAKLIAADRRIRPSLDFIAKSRKDSDRFGPHAAPSKLTRLRFDIHEGWQRKSLYVARTLFAPRPAHVKFLALPPWGSFLYFVVRPLHDYVLLPVWLAWRHMSRRPL